MGMRVIEWDVAYRANAEGSTPSPVLYGDPLLSIT